MLLVNILINMILRPYFVFFHMLGNSMFVILFLHFSWLLFHISRLILIVEPAQKLTDELEDIRMVVRKLLSGISNKDSDQEVIFL